VRGGRRGEKNLSGDETKPLYKRQRFHAVMGPASLSGRGQRTYIQQKKGQMGGWILKEQENFKKRYPAFEEQVDEEMRSCSLYNLKIRGKSFTCQETF
jgi:hypothetical protein